MQRQMSDWKFRLIWHAILTYSFQSTHIGYRGTLNYFNKPFHVSNITVTSTQILFAYGICKKTQRGNGSLNCTIWRKYSLSNKWWVPSDWKINKKKTNLKYKVIDETCSRYNMIMLTYCTCVCSYLACGCVADMQDTGCAPYHANIAENHVFDCPVCSY